MIGRARVPDPVPDRAAQELAALHACVDQVRALVRDRAWTHAGNRDLVDLALDIDLALRPRADVPVIPGR